jgi:hypothetical protein
MSVEIRSICHTLHNLAFGPTLPFRTQGIIGATDLSEHPFGVAAFHMLIGPDDHAAEGEQATDGAGPAVTAAPGGTTEGAST